MISFEPRSGSISITAGETRGMNNPEPSALKGLNINKVQPLPGLVVRETSMPRISPVVIPFKPFQGFELVFLNRNKGWWYDCDSSNKHIKNLHKVQRLENIF